MSIITLHKGYCNEYLSLPDTFDIEIDKGTLQDIHKFVSILTCKTSEGLQDIHSINLQFVADFIDWELEEEFYDEFTYDVEYLRVYPSGDVWWYAQGKYDCSVYVEYKLEL